MSTPTTLPRAAAGAARAQKEWAATPHPVRAGVLRRAGQRHGGTQANIDAFTETRWITMRREPGQYPL